MNWVDILILVLVLGTGFLGWRNGVIRWAFTLAGGIVGVLLAGRLYKTLAPLIPGGDSEGVQQLVAFGVIFVAVMVGAWIAARIVKRVLNLLLLGWVDSVAGLALGLIAGAFAATALISVMGIVPSQSLKDAVAESSLAEPLTNNLGVVRSFLPSEFDEIKQLFELKDKLQGGLDILQDQAQGLIGSGSGFAIQWQGLDDFAGSTIFAVFEPESAGAATLGPVETTVQDDGTARLEVQIDGDVVYDIFYFVDGNDNGICDESGADVKRHEVADPGIEELGIFYIGLNIADEGICDHLG